MAYFKLTIVGVLWIICSPACGLRPEFLNYTGNVIPDMIDKLFHYPDQDDILRYLINEDLYFECRFRSRMNRILDEAPDTIFSHNGTDIPFYQHDNGSFRLTRTSRGRLRMFVNFTDLSLAGRYGCRLEGHYQSQPFVISRYWIVNVRERNKEAELSGTGPKGPVKRSRRIGPVRFAQTAEGYDENSGLTVRGFRGENKEISCLVYGKQPINITWFYEGQRILPHQLVLNNTNQEIIQKFMASEKLELKTLTKEVNEKMFRCVATQSYNGEVRNISRQFKVYVHDRIPLKILNRETQLTAPIGSDFIYNCEILKSEEIQGVAFFRWFSADPSTLTQENATGFIASGNATLHISNVQREDAKSYWCYVQRDGEMKVKQFQLNITEPSLLSSSGTSGTDQLVIIVAVCVSAILVLCMVFVVVYLKKRRKKSRKPKKKIIILEANDAYACQDIKTSGSDSSRPLIPTVTIEGRNRLSSEITSYSDYEFPVDEKWEIPRIRMNFMHNIGSGEFGCVHYGELHPLPSDDQQEPKPVAIKMLKSDATVNELIDLLQELEMMKRFEQHRNIINLIGCVSCDGPLWVVVEYAKHGNLRDFLRSHRPMNAYHTVVSNVTVDDDIEIKLRDLISFAYQVACGMEFLAQNKCIHRDLAARNVLVAEDLVIKIADFGLTREVHQDYYKKLSDGKLPIKWMAPEALIDRKYTSKSDVWSYGVLLWEIFTLGGNPYPTTPHERLFEVLKEGHRMDCPPYASEHMYATMRQCWMYHPAQRPSFSEIAQDLDVILSKTGHEEELSMELSPLNSPTTSSTSCSASEDQDPMLPPVPQEL